MPIVVVPVSYNSATCLFTSDIALGTQGGLLAQTDVANTLISRYEVANRVGSIINNNQFFVRIILAQEVGNSLGDKCPTVICGHNATDQRMIFTPTIFTNARAREG